MTKLMTAERAATYAQTFDVDVVVNQVNRALNAPRGAGELFATPTKKGLRLESGVTPYSCAVIVDNHTGVCGESWTEQAIIYAGTDVDAFGQESAMENATSYGSEGEEICDDCRENVNDCDCECSSGSTWHENENICGMVYKIQPSRSLDYVNGGSNWSEIMEAAKDLEVLTVHPETGAVCIYRGEMERFLYLPNHEEWSILLKEVEHHFKTKMVVVV